MLTHPRRPLLRLGVNWGDVFELGARLSVPRKRTRAQRSVGMHTETEDWDSDTFNSTPTSTSVSVSGVPPPGKGDKEYISFSAGDDANEDANDAADDEDELYQEYHEEEDGKHAPSNHMERDTARCTRLFSRCPYFFKIKTLANPNAP